MLGLTLLPAWIGLGLGLLVTECDDATARCDEDVLKFLLFLFPSGLAGNM